MYLICLYIKTYKQYSFYTIYDHGSSAAGLYSVSNIEYVWRQRNAGRPLNYFCQTKKCTVPIELITSEIY